MSRRSLRLTASVVGFLVLAGSAWWCTHPGGFAGGVHDGVGADVVVGQPWAFDAGVYPAGGPDVVYEVAVDRVTAQVVENTAAADVTVMRCILSSTDRLGAGPAADLAQLCVKVDDPTDGSTSFGRGAQLLVMVTAHQPGHVRIDGVDLSYHRGVRSGTAHLGNGIDVSTR